MSHVLTIPLVVPVYMEYTPRRVRVPASPRAGLQHLRGNEALKNMKLSYVGDTDVVDILLPKLLSGDLPIKPTQTELERAV
jgi:hypothetical protein